MPQVLNICFLTGLLFACRTPTTDTKVVEPEDATTLMDADSDGYLNDEDCDDLSASIHPNAEEICDGVDNNCDGQIDEDVTNEFYLDADQDGFGDENEQVVACTAPANYVPNGNDCNDDDPTVYPAAAEVCDEVDNNCDGEVDENFGGLWYPDIDGDGFGVEEGAIQGCTEFGYVAVVGDCDDNDANVFPSAQEICDNIDNDCDDFIDEGLRFSYYLDVDNDGYGDDNNIIESCTLEDNMSTIGGDCDDINPMISPDEDEVCGDDIDNDCDGNTDDGSAVDALIFYADNDGDNFGNANVTISACEMPTGYTTDTTDCNDQNNAQHPGAQEYCNGQDDDCDGLFDEDSPIGSSTYYTDMDQDGFGDPNSSVISCNIPPGTSTNNLDCDDSDGTIYLGAMEICDGQINACGGSLPFTEIDNDGDGYVECVIANSGWDGDVAVIGGGDCLDTQNTVYPSAPQICDGMDNTCSSNLPVDEIDNDADGYVECNIDSSGWIGSILILGGDDCDDAQSSIHPNAPEICDGLDNTCAGTLPLPERDDDGDLFVECTVAVSGWDGQPNILGGDDCDDLDGNTFPGAGSNESNALACMTDVDGDGYGEQNPSTAVVPGTDCDDTDAALNPGDGSCYGLSCKDIWDSGNSIGSDIYTIDPDGFDTGLPPFDVYCDMNPLDPGWTEIPYASDLTYGQHFSGGDPSGGYWLPVDFQFDLSDAQIAALQAVSTEGRQDYVGLCNHVIHYFYASSGNYVYAFGFEFFDGSTLGGNVSLNGNPMVSILQDGCAGNGGEGGAISLATVFSFSTALVPLRNVRCRDCGDSGEFFGSPLTNNSAWLR